MGGERADGKEIPDWREVQPRGVGLTIYYRPVVGGECITACPRGGEIWEVRPVRTSLFGLRRGEFLRPVMARPDLCLGCLICVEACLTGALRVGSDGAFGGALGEISRLALNLLRLPLKGKYGLRYTFSRKHLRKFLKNDFSPPDRPRHPDS